MHTENISFWQHAHAFHTGNKAGERRALIVAWLTVTMMVIEIAAGWVFNSMALLADGWHMSTHAAALGISALAYMFARRHATDRRFTFGTWKMEVLGGFTSAILLGLVAAGMLIVAGQRLFHPKAIQYNEAIVVAVIGLVINLICAFVLRDDSVPQHEQAHLRHSHHNHHHHHTDLNLRAAYLHVIADSLTSVLAIIALLGGKFMQWQWLDPWMGIVGALVIARWTYTLVRETSAILLDRGMDSQLVQEIRSTIESDRDTRISDLHLWRVGQRAYACILAVVAKDPRDPDYYKQRLRAHHELVHVTVECHVCSNGPAIGA